MFRYICLALLVGIALTGVQSSKFLALPYTSNSHYFAMKKIAGELAERGHEVVLLAFKSKEKESRIHPKVDIVTCSQVDTIIQHDELTTQLIRNKTGFAKTLNLVQELNEKLCDCILSDNELLEKFKSCDGMIDDISLLCAPAIHDLLQIPRAVFYCGLVPPTIHSWMHGIPLPLSYIPHMATGFTDKMSFLQRAGNVIHFSLTSIFLYIYVSSVDKSIKARYDFLPKREFWESACDSDLVLAQTDFVINYARPIPPGILTIGPLSPQPPKPLPDDLERFMDFPLGVVVVSFGSEVEATIFQSDVLDKMNAAFGRLKQRVLWKFQATPEISMSKNIKLLPWIPQNDVLGHVNTKLFITHVGHNGMFEAAYHGVPMVGIPLVMDQLDNARMMENAGLGAVVNIHQTTANDLLTIIEKVLQQPSFRANATRVSKLLKDRRRTPVEEAADHLEYMVRHGGTKHLRPASLDIPWYQYFLIDVIIFLVVIAIIGLGVLVFVTRLLVRLCFKNLKTVKRD